MTTNELRAKFEAFLFEEGWLAEDDTIDYSHADIGRMWASWQAAHASRDDENNKGRHGKFRICWLDSSREGFITTDGVSCDGKDEEAIVRIFDKAMHVASKSE